MIPQANILDGIGVAYDVVLGEFRVAGQIARLHRIEVERPAGRLDVVRHVRRFRRLFVWRHDEALNGAAVKAAGDRRHQVHDHRQWHRPQRGRERVVQREQRGKNGCHRNNPQDRHARHHVGIGRAVHDVPASDVRQQVRNLEIGMKGKDEENRGKEQRQMPTRFADHRHAAALREVQRAGQHICHRRSGKRHDEQRQEKLLGDIENRQPVDVETDVVAENGIDDAERHAVPELQPLKPLAACREADHERDDGGADARELSQLFAAHHRRLHGAAASADDDVRTGNRRDSNPEIAVEDEERDAQHERTDRRSGFQALKKDIAIAHCAEPQPFHQEIDERWKDDEREEGDDRQAVAECAASIHVEFISILHPRKLRPILKFLTEKPLC